MLEIQTGIGKRICSLVFHLSVMLLISACAHQEKGANNMNLTQDKIIGIAQEAAVSHGYNNLFLDYNSVNKNNNLWKKYVSKNKNFWDYAVNLKKKLEKRKFYAIYFRPQEKFQFGGDLWVFIDCNTGKILYLLPGK